MSALIIIGADFRMREVDETQRSVKTVRQAAEIGLVMRKTVHGHEHSQITGAVGAAMLSWQMRMKDQ